ncbi:MAG: sigma-70 family RNA polymerase sigma factor [Candidatus Omnitrophica bacterium]|nr:sigma-70 family RNA polymerase sigma factor [Candidatus Omnitrophota bacterium]
MESLKLYLKEIRNIPLLTPKEEKELSMRIKKGDEYARKRMIQANLRLVINIAKRYMYLGIPFMDLIEEGNLGLMKAVDKFNPRKGYRFSTYAAWWIKQGITRSISEQGKMIRVPVYMNELINKWKKKREELAHKLKRVPRDEEIATSLRLPQGKVEQIKFWLTATTSSLDAPAGEDSDSQISDLIEDETVKTPDSGIKEMFDKERLNNLLETMNERERKILDMRFGLVDGETKTLAQVADKLGVSRERVRQIEEAALKRLRKFLKQQE